MALNIGASVFGTHLLRMTIDAAIRRVDARAAHYHTRRRHGIGVATVFIRLGIQTANLKIWHHRHAEPREGENAEDTEKKRLQTLHQCPPPGFASSGFKNVGTLAVRPKPSSIKPKWKAKTQCATVNRIQERVQPRR